MLVLQKLGKEDWETLQKSEDIVILQQERDRLVEKGEARQTQLRIVSENDLLRFQDRR